MGIVEWLLIGLGALVVIWLVFMAALALSGRREEAKALARFIPDCIVLLRRVAAEGEVSGRTKLLLVLTVAYLAFPIDVVPDFIPILGHLDDALLLLWTLRSLLREVPSERLEELWPGPEESLRAVQRLAGR